MPNVNSPAKATSDLHLTYARLLHIKTDLEEIMRLGQITVDPVDQENINTVDAWISNIRGQIALL